MRAFRLSRLVVLPLLAALLAAPVHAQNLTFGQLSGTVRDGSGRPVPTAHVRVEERASGAVRATSTARDGSFLIVSLPAGRYTVRVEALGYRPVVLLDVDVGASQATRLNAAIQAAAPPVTTVDTVPRRGDAGTAGDWLFERGFGELVGPRRLVSEVALLSTVADESSVEGLPWRYTEAMVEGARMGFVGSPTGLGTDGAALALPTRAFSGARAGGLGFDVEVGGSGVGVSATSQRGARMPVTRATAEGGTANIGAAFATGGPIQSDTAQAYGGVDYQRSTIAPAEAVDGDERIDERVSAFGRLDWQPGERIAISARASGTRYTSRGTAEPFGLAASFGNEFEGIGLQASANLYGRLNRYVSTEWRVSTDVGSASGTAGADQPRTLFANSGLTAGSVVGGPFEDQRTSSRVTGLLHLDLGAHRVKGGFSAAFNQHDLRFAQDDDGSFAFGSFDAADPLTQRGVFRRVAVPSYAGEFRTSEMALLIQDHWELADGLTLTLGARSERFTLPLGRIETNAGWAGATGLDNAAVRGPGSRLSPRLGLRWELGSDREWVIEGGGGVFHDLPDRRDLAEVLTFDRGAEVFAATGDLSSWPDAPSGTTSRGRTITMLGPDFEGPRTQRMSLGITRRAGAWSSSISGVYRHTDFLARRRDLNLPSAPVGSDQYGRPLYGTLTQVGALLTAVPGSNRRFGEFEAAHVLEATGFNAFYGITAALERVSDEGLSLGLAYTYGHTRDNVAGYSLPQLSPFPSGLDGQDWLEGRSDFDVPHRLLVAADWAASSAVRFGLVYRLSSGLPFTPGVRGGVDANGDGDSRNDPAFIDGALTGMDTLRQEWGCLNDDVGGFATRNSCRGALQHRLDVRVALRLGSLGFGKADLVLEALNVVSQAMGPVDRALLVVDPTAALSIDPGTGATIIPYTVNPNFGKILTDRSPGVLWRVGVRISP